MVKVKAVDQHSAPTIPRTWHLLSLSVFWDKGHRLKDINEKVYSGKDAAALRRDQENVVFDALERQQFYN